jgi:hypothetical protein
MPLFQNSTNPLFAAANAGRAAAKFRSGYQPQMAQQEEADAPPDLPKSSEFDVTDALGKYVLSPLAAAGNVLDLPDSMFRDMLYGENPFDQLLDPLGYNVEENRVDSRKKYQEWGMASQEDNWLNFGGGLVTEMALSPTTYLGFGALGRIGAAFAKAGVNTKVLKRLTKEVAERGGAKGAKIGSRWGHYTTGKRILDEAKRTRDEAAKSLADSKGSKYVKGEFSSLDDLPSNAKEGSFAVVDNGSEYNIHKYAVDENKAADWILDNEATAIFRGEIAEKALGYTTHNNLKNVAKEYYTKRYGEGWEEALATQPLTSMVSFKMPFMEGTRTSLYDMSKRGNVDDLYRQRMERYGAKVDEPATAGGPHQGPNPQSPGSGPTQPPGSGPGPQPGPQQGPQPGAGPQPGPQQGPQPGPAQPPPKKSPVGAAANAVNQSVQEASDNLSPQDAAGGGAKMGRPKKSEHELAWTELRQKLGDVDTGGEQRRSRLRELHDAYGEKGTAKAYEEARVFARVMDTIVKNLADFTNRSEEEVWGSFKWMGNAEGQLDKIINSLRESDLAKRVADIQTARAAKQAAGSSDEAVDVATETLGAMIEISGKKIIGLFKDSDFGTLSHEFMHFTRKMLPNNSELGRKSAVAVAKLLHKKGVASKADLKNVKTWADFRKMGEEVAIEAEEAFAEAFERYLREGKTSNPGLVNLFERIKGFMLSIYDTLTKEQMPINKDLREVFSKLTENKKNRDIANQKAAEASKVADTARAAKEAKADKNATLATPEGLLKLAKTDSEKVAIGKAHKVTPDLTLDEVQEMLDHARAHPEKPHAWVEKSNEFARRRREKSEASQVVVEEAPAAQGRQAEEAEGLDKIVRQDPTNRATTAVKGRPRSIIPEEPAVPREGPLSKAARQLSEKAANQDAPPAARKEVPIEPSMADNLPKGNALSNKASKGRALPEDAPLAKEAEELEQFTPTPVDPAVARRKAENAAIAKATSEVSSEIDNIIAKYNQQAQSGAKVSIDDVKNEISQAIGKLRNLRGEEFVQKTIKRTLDVSRKEAIEKIDEISRKIPAETADSTEKIAKGMKSLAENRKEGELLSKMEHNGVGMLQHAQAISRSMARQFGLANLDDLLPDVYGAMTKAISAKPEIQPTELIKLAFRASRNFAMDSLKRGGNPSGVTLREQALSYIKGASKETKELSKEVAEEFMRESLKKGMPTSISPGEAKDIIDIAVKKIVHGVKDEEIAKQYGLSNAQLKTLGRKYRRAAHNVTQKSVEVGDDATSYGVGPNRMSGLEAGDKVVKDFLEKYMENNKNKPLNKAIAHLHFNEKLPIKEIVKEVNKLGLGKEVNDAKVRYVINYALKFARENSESLRKNIDDLPSATSFSDRSSKVNFQIRSAKEAAKKTAEAAGAKSAKEVTQAKKEWQEKGVRSSFFKRWFGDWEKDPANASKVVDAEGKPLVMYHGTRRPGFDTFRKDMPSDGVNRRSVISLTPDRKFAQMYADGDWGIYELYVNARNIADFRNPKHVAKRLEWERKRTEEWLRSGELDAKAWGIDTEEGLQRRLAIEVEKRRAAIESGHWLNWEDESFLRENGFDAAWVKEAPFDHSWKDQPVNIAVLDPNQIKSATANSGDFDKAKNSILFQNRAKKGIKSAETAGAKNADEVAAAKKEWMERGILSSFFRRWSNELPVVKNGGDEYEGGAAVFEAYHGSTHSGIEVFKKTGSKEGFVGQGPYFSTNPADASANYAGVGPDLRFRINGEIDKIYEYLDDYDRMSMVEDYLSTKGIDLNSVDDIEEAILEHLDDAVRYTAEKSLKGDNDGIMYKTYVRLKRPADTTGRSTDASNIFSDKMLNNWIRAAREVAREYYVDIDDYIDALKSIGGDGFPTVTMQDAFDLAAKHITGAFDDISGEAISGRGLFREIAERAGYDGVIMDADKYFGPTGRKSLAMEGITEGTYHIIPFKRNSIKSAIGNQGTFYNNEENIYLQARAKKKAQEIVDNGQDAVTKIQNGDTKGPKINPTPAQVKLLSQMGDRAWVDWALDVMDAGEHVFLNNPAMRAAARYLDAETLGAYSEQGQEIARRYWDAHHRSISEVRTMTTGLVRALGDSGVFDERKVLEKFSKLPEKEGREAATKLLNDRHGEFIKFMENNKYTLKAELFDDLSPAQLQELNEQLDLVKQIFPSELMLDALAGVRSIGLRDDYVLYFPRHHEGRARVGTSIKRGQKLADTKSGYYEGRKLWVRNLPGGRAVIDDLSIDRNVSGKYLTAEVIQDKPTAFQMITTEDGKTMRAVDYIRDNYESRILGDNDYLLGKDGKRVVGKDGKEKLSKAGNRKLQSLTRAVLAMEPHHAQDQMPYYGRNFIYDVMKRIETGHAKRNVALLAQELAARSITQGEQAYSLIKYMRATGLDNANAYKNVIRKQGHSAEYAEFAAKRIEELKGKLEKNGEVRMGNKSLIANNDEVYIKSGKDGMNVSRVNGTLDDALELFDNVPRRFASSKKYTVDSSVFEEGVRILKPWTAPEEMRGFSKVANSVLNFFKAHVTIPFPSFHTRNFLSGMSMNFFFGANDPTDKLGGGFLKPVMQAWKLRSGKTVGGLYGELPQWAQEHALRRYPNVKNKDEAASKWVTDEIFAHGLTGDKQGYAADRAVDSAAGVISQMPGARKSDYFGVFNKPHIHAKWYDRLNPFHIRGGGRPVKVHIDSSAAQEMAGKANPDRSKRYKWQWEKYEDSRFLWSQYGEEAATFTEDILRTSAFLGYIKQGMQTKNVADQVMKMHFDYSKLSEFERKYAKNIIPFWTYTRNAVPLVLGELATNPGGRMAWSIRAGEMGREPSEMAPEYIQRSAAIGLGKTPTGANQYVTGLGLPYEDALSLLGFATGDAQGTFQEILSRTRPELQYFTDSAYGRSAFFDKALGDLDPPIGRLGRNLYQMATGAELEGQAEPFISRTVENILSKTPGSRYINSLNTLLDQRRGTAKKLLNLGTGVRLTDVEPWQQERAAIDRATEMLKDYGGRTMELPYVPDWAKERLPQDKKEELEAIMEFMKGVKKQSREKKKEAEALAAALAAGGQ